MRFLYTMSYFTSLERIENRLDDLFVFKDPEKEVKIRLHDASLHSVIFYEPEKKLKWTRTFDTRFKERDQSVVTNAHRLFPFYGSAKKSKKNFQDFTATILLSCNDSKQVLNVAIDKIKGL